MKPPLLVLFREDGTHTVHAFPSQPAYRAQLETEEAHAQAKGLKLSGYAGPAGPCKANFYVTHPAAAPAVMPTPKEVRAILKQYKEANR
ncbi:MAG: hypothetical protein JNK97_04865 [Zoogloea sp.]|nr:hypothetical protein [Zoogloea sp.]